MIDMSVETSGNKISDRMKDEEIYDSRRLRETAKIASIYHKSDNKFQRNKKLSHIVHASLNFVQFVSYHTYIYNIYHITYIIYIYVLRYNMIFIL